MRDKRNAVKTLAIAATCIVAVVIVVILLIFQYIQYRQGPGHEDVHEEDSDIEYREEVAIYNQETVDAIIGRERAVSQYRCMQNIFLLPTEKESATSKNNSPEGLDNYYGATIDKENIGSLKMTPSEWSYSIPIKLSDGRKYDWFLRLDTDYRYSYSVVKNQAIGTLYYCVSDESNIPSDEVSDWMINTLQIDPYLVGNFKN